MYDLKPDGDRIRQPIAAAIRSTPLRLGSRQIKMGLPMFLCEPSELGKREGRADIEGGLETSKSLSIELLQD